MVEFIIWRIHPKTKVPSKHYEGDESEDDILKLFKGALTTYEDDIFALRIRGK